MGPVEVSVGGSAEEVLSSHFFTCLKKDSEKL
jgi:hypothetical protein